MAGEPHNVMNEVAFALLPKWQQRKWKSTGKDIGTCDYAAIPDMYYANKRKYGKYCKLPNGKLVPHALTNKEFVDFPSLTRDAPDYDNNLYVTTYYLKKIVRLIQQRKYHEAVLFACTFTHYLQDAVWPAHVMNNSLFPLLLPFPKGKYWHLHRVMDGTAAGINREKLMRVKPGLLGTTVTEAAYNLLNQVFRGVNKSMGLIMPQIQAIYQSDSRKKGKILTQLTLIGLDLTVSAWYTAFCIAEKRFSEKELDRLSIVHLSDIPAFNRFKVWEEPLDLLSHDPYLFEPLRDHALKMDGGVTAPMKTIPLSVFVQKNNRVVKEIIPKGFGAAGRSRITFRIDGSIHKIFQTMFGLHSTMKSTQKEVFKIFLGSDVDNLREVFNSGSLSCSDPARTVKLDLKKQTKYLVLVTEGKMTDYLQIVWGNPVLIRK